MWGSYNVGFSARLPVGPFAGKPLPNALWELEERAHPKTEEDVRAHRPPLSALPLSQADSRHAHTAKLECQEETRTGQLRGINSMDNAFKRKGQPVARLPVKWFAFGRFPVRE